MEYDFLYAFKNETTLIVEIKVKGLPENTPRDLKYHWLLVNEDKCEKLTFQSMQKEPTQVRVFAEGVLQFNSNEAIYSNEYNKESFEAIQSSEIDLETLQLIESKLIQLIANK